MSEQALTLIFSTLPQFGFAIFLYWMCSKQADKQRESHMAQIDAMLKLAERIIDRVDDVIALAKQFRPD